MRALILVTLLSLVAASCSEAAQTADSAGVQPPEPDLPQGAQTAVFASGCFWCTEADFEKLDGVYDVVSGYTGGDVADPSYRQVVNGGTGHAEAARVIYDPEAVSYQALLEHYWRNVDPFDGAGQFCDRGDSYAPFIFVDGAEQADLAERSRQAVQDRFPQQPIQVRIRELDAFWPAEEYHQDYAEKNPIRYQRYRFGCRRDARLRDIWGAEAGGVN